MNPFAPELLRRLAQGPMGTPLWVYDAATVRERIDSLRPFDVIRYAQKANANLHLLRLMRAQGVRIDAVLAGRDRAGRWAAGYEAAEIVFTADLIDETTLARVGGRRASRSMPGPWTCSSSWARAPPAMPYGCA
jgi:diaminopimelate decarboxylase